MGVGVDGVSVRYGQWFAGFGLLFLLWALYVWRPRVGASAAMMLTFGTLLYQFREKKGVFASVQ